MTYLLYLLAGIGYGLLALVILELMYIIVMALDRANKEQKLAPWFVVVGHGFMYVGLVWDILCNIFVASFVFMEPPRELTISARLRRLVKHTGWRKQVALWFSINLLNPFSVKPHIKLDT